MKRIVSFGIFASLLPLGCNQHPVKPAEYDGNSDDEVTVELEVNKNVDILFVIDNSGSMGEEQANLAANFDPFIKMLEEKDVEANYRIAITTTDNGNPRCGGATTPEGGAFVLSSCLDRLDQFIFNGAQPVNVQNIACTDICGLDGDALEIQPTITDEDPNPKARPWLENIEGQTNLPEGVNTTEAFQCFGPQGVDGCGFESPLESMYKALARTQNSNEASYGFLRRDALLAIVFVTDEVDCSAKPTSNELFMEPNPLWHDDEADWPSSAVCWNAGVECMGGPGTYDDCYSVDRDMSGNLTDDPEQAVLHPVSRYIDFVDALEQSKKSLLGNDKEVIVTVISGVPGNGGEVVYADSPDADFMADFGIGPGCTSDDEGAAGTLQTAVPPVRMREFAEAFQNEDRPNMFSVCSDDYSPALEEVADAIRTQFEPACFPRCVEDLDPITDGVQPNCFVKQRHPELPDVDVPECRLVGEEWVLPDAEVDACYFVRDDASGTGSTLDDMHEDCVADGWNVQFEIVRREGTAAPADAQVMATCQLAELPTITCPDAL